MAETASSLLLPAPISIDPHMKLKHRFLGFVSCLWATGLFLPPISHCESATGQQGTPHDSPIAQGESFKKGLTALKENRLEAALVELTAAERQDTNDRLATRRRAKEVKARADRRLAKQLQALAPSPHSWGARANFAPEFRS